MTMLFSLLLGVVKEAAEVYKQMQNGRRGSFFNAYLPSKLQFLSEKLPPFESIYKKHLYTTPAEQSIALLIQDILDIKAPSTTAEAAESASVADDQAQEEVNSVEQSIKTKFGIVSEILKVCANFSNKTFTQVETLEKLNELKLAFNKEFKDVVADKEYYLLIVDNFVSIVGELQTKEMLVGQVSALTNANQESTTALLNTNLEKVKKDLKDLEDKSATVKRDLEDKLQQAYRDCDEQTQKYLDLKEVQTQYDIVLAQQKQAADTRSSGYANRKAPTSHIDPLMSSYNQTTPQVEDNASLKKTIESLRKQLAVERSQSEQRLKHIHTLEADIAELKVKLQIDEDFSAKHNASKSSSATQATVRKPAVTYLPGINFLPPPRPNIPNFAASVTPTGPGLTSILQSLRPQGLNRY
jgi:hypothetical protein